MYSTWMDSICCLRSNSFSNHSSHFTQLTNFQRLSSVKFVFQCKFFHTNWACTFISKVSWIIFFVLSCYSLVEFGSCTSLLLSSISTSPLLTSSSIMLTEISWDSSSVVWTALFSWCQWPLITISLNIFMNSLSFRLDSISKSIFSFKNISLYCNRFLLFKISIRFFLGLGFFSHSFCFYNIFYHV